VLFVLPPAEFVFGDGVFVAPLGNEVGMSSLLSVGVCSCGAIGEDGCEFGVGLSSTGALFDGSIVSITGITGLCGVIGSGFGVGVGLGIGVGFVGLGMGVGLPTPASDCTDPPVAPEVVNTLSPLVEIFPAASTETTLK